MYASELKVGKNRVLALFGDAVKSDIANGLLPPLTYGHLARLHTILQEVLESAITESVPALNGISNPNRPLTKKRKRDGNNHATYFESCRSMLPPTPAPHVNRNLLKDPHAAGALSQPSPGVMGPPQTPDLAGYHNTLPSRACSAQRPDTTHMSSPLPLSDSYQTFNYSQMSTSDQTTGHLSISAPDQMSELPQISDSPQAFGGPTEYAVWDPDELSIDQVMSNRNGFSGYG